MDTSKPNRSKEQSRESESKSAFASEVLSPCALGTRFYLTTLTGAPIRRWKRSLLQFSEFGAGRFEDRDAGVRVFPQREEFLVGSARGRFGTSEGLCASLPQMGERTGPAVPHHSPVIDQFLEFEVGLRSTLRSQVRLCAKINRDHAGIA